MCLVRLDAVFLGVFNAVALIIERDRVVELVRLNCRQRILSLAYRHGLCIGIGEPVDAAGDAEAVALADVALELWVDIVLSVARADHGKLNARRVDGLPVDCLLPLGDIYSRFVCSRSDLLLVVFRVVSARAAVFREPQQ